MLKDLSQQQENASPAAGHLHPGTLSGTLGCAGLLDWSTGGLYVWHLWDRGGALGHARSVDLMSCRHFEGLHQEGLASQ